MFPGSAREPLHRHLERVRRQHDRDLARGAGRIELPSAPTVYTQVLNRGARGLMSPADRLPRDPREEP